MPPADHSVNDPRGKKKRLHWRTPGESRTLNEHLQTRAARDAYILYRRSDARVLSRVGDQATRMDWVRPKEEGGIVWDPNDGAAHRPPEFYLGKEAALVPICWLNFKVRKGGSTAAGFGRWNTPNCGR